MLYNHFAMSPRLRSSAMRSSVQQVVDLLFHDFYKCQGVYIIFLSLGMFFFTLLLLTIGIKNSSQSRASIHNGFWFWKLVILVGIVVGMAYTMFFHLNADAVDLFLKIWMWTGVVTGDEINF